MASDPSTVLLATRSKDKAHEIRRILGHSVRLLSLDDAGVPPTPLEDTIETFPTFRENAIAKARYFERITGLPTLADDSGICADALGGRPGVRSRRFSGRADLDGRDLDRVNNQTLLDALADVPDTDRGVHYVCVAALLSATAAHVCAVGTVTGRLLRQPLGSRGFGYDPLFLLPHLGLTFAQLDSDSKNRISHRGRAFRALAVALP